MKSVIGIVIAALALLEVEVGATPISAAMPDFLVETIAQAVICRKQLNFKAKSNEELSITNVLAEDSPAFNEYFGCIWQKKRIIDNNGNIFEEALQQYFIDLFTMGEKITEGQKRLVKTVMERCKDVLGKDYGDRAVKVHNCALRFLYKAVEDSDNASHTKN